MALPQRDKRKAMDAVAHPETAAQRKLFKRGGRDAAVGGPVAAPRPGPPRETVFDEMKRRVMDSISNVETVAQVGLIKLTGGVALYVARIRQMDRENQQQRAQAQSGPNRRDTRVERLERE